MTAVARPVNLMAGTSCRYRSFLSYALAGEALWIILYGGMGYLFSSQWDFIVSILGGFGWLVLVLAILAGGLYLWVRKSNRLTTLRFKTVKTSEV
jgi:membrane-associated protein